jgi:flagellar assembly factor FliW
MVGQESKEVRAVLERSEDEELPAVSMVRPIPGFENLTLFALVEVGGNQPLPVVSSLSDPTSVLFELVSIEQPAIRFLVAIPTAFFPEYTFDLDQPTCDALGLVDQDDVLTLIVLTIGDAEASTTANLLAPVILNARTRQAAQVILSGTSWPVRALIE